MSAQLLGSGQAFDIIDSSYLKEAPQVHLHFMTDEKEYAANGSAKLELCCHGCGAATLLYYLEYGSPDAADRKSLKVRDEFSKQHKNCPNRGYDKLCPNYRASIKVIDLRPAKFAQDRPVLRDKAEQETLSSETLNARRPRHRTRQCRRPTR